MKRTTQLPEEWRRELSRTKFLFVRGRAILYFFMNHSETPHLERTTAVVNYDLEPKIHCPVCDEAEYQVLAKRFDSGPVVRCIKCQHIYLNPVPPAEYLRNINETAHGFGEDKELLDWLRHAYVDPKGGYQRALQMTEKLGGLRGKKVLEVGSGPGIFLQMCKERGALITGLDLSVNSSKIAQRNFGFSLVTKSLEEAMTQGDFADGSFDWIFAFEVIEHVYRPVDFLKCIYRLTKPGGHACLSTPNFGLFYNMGSAAPALRGIADHIHFFDKATLSSCLTQSGFKVVETFTVSPIAMKEAQKMVLTHKQPILRVWNLIRTIPGVRTLKDFLLNHFSQKKEKEIAKGDASEWGGALVSLVQRLS